MGFEVEPSRVTGTRLPQWLGSCPPRFPIRAPRDTFRELAAAPQSGVGASDTPRPSPGVIHGN
jgi:hypothetical protein